MFGRLLPFPLGFDQFSGSMWVRVMSFLPTPSKFSTAETHDAWFRKDPASVFFDGKHLAVEVPGSMNQFVKAICIFFFKVAGIIGGFSQ